MSASECRVARKARQDAAQGEREQHYLRALAHRVDWFTWKRDRDFGRNEPIVDWPRDTSILYAKDRERETMQALREVWPLGIGAGSGT